MTIEERQKIISDFEHSFKGKSLDELKKIEEKLVEEADKIDKEVTSQEFDLAEENYEIVARNIRMFLDTQTVQWQYTLGMVGMYDFWDPENKPATIPYPQLDGILRTLGSMQFTGYEQWAAVIAINKYFEPLHEAYEKATERIIIIGAKHNALMDEMARNEPIGDLSSKSTDKMLN